MQKIKPVPMVRLSRESNKRCKKCRFHGYASGSICCDYGMIMKTPRSLICPPGDDCTVFEPKTKRRENEHIHIYPSAQKRLNMAQEERERKQHEQENQKKAARKEC